MNRTRITVAATLAGALGLALASYGQAPSPQLQRGQTNELSKSAPTTQMSAQAFKALRASEIVGKDIKGTTQEDLGEVDDFAIDLQQGYVAAVVISQKGGLGTSGKLIAVPAKAFTLTTTGERGKDHQLMLNVPADKLQSAPAFRWESATRESLMTAFQHFGQTPYWQEGGESSSRQPVRDPETTQPAEPSQAPRAGQSASAQTLRKASDVIGMDIHDNRAADLGEVNDLVLDLSSARILAAIVASGGILGLGETLHAVPPGQLRFAAEQDTLTANFSKDKLDKAPKFTSNMWTAVNDPKWATDVYGYYQESPFWESDAQRVRERSTPPGSEYPPQQPQQPPQPRSPSEPTPSPQPPSR